MSKEDFIVVTGHIIESYANSQYLVSLDSGQKIIAHVSGRMRKNYIKIVAGDKVKIEISPYDLSKGRISYRY